MANVFNCCAGNLARIREATVRPPAAPFLSWSRSSVKTESARTHNNCLLPYPFPYKTHNISVGRSQWSRVLGRGCDVARLLGLRVRILPRAWMFVCCEFGELTSRCLCVGADPWSSGALSTVMCLSKIRCNTNHLQLQWAGRRGRTEKGRKKERKKQKHISVASLKLNSFTVDRMSLARQPVNCQQIGAFRINTLLTPYITTLLCDKHQWRHLSIYHASLINKVCRVAQSI